MAMGSRHASFLSWKRQNQQERSDVQTQQQQQWSIEQDSAIRADTKQPLSHRHNNKNHEDLRLDRQQQNEEDEDDEEEELMRMIAEREESEAAHQPVEHQQQFRYPRRPMAAHFSTSVPQVQHDADDDTDDGVNNFFSPVRRPEVDDSPRDRYMQAPTPPREQGPRMHRPNGYRDYVAERRNEKHQHNDTKERRQRQEHPHRYYSNQTEDMEQRLRSDTQRMEYKRRRAYEQDLWTNIYSEEWRDHQLTSNKANHMPSTADFYNDIPRSPFGYDDDDRRDGKYHPPAASPIIAEIDGGFVGRKYKDGFDNHRAEGSNAYTSDSIAYASPSPLSPSVNIGKQTSGQWQSNEADYGTRNDGDRSNAQQQQPERGDDDDRKNNRDNSNNREYLRAISPDSQGTLLSGAVLPRWSVVCLISCFCIGVSGFFLEEVVDIIGAFTNSTPFVITVSQQVHMRRRLEALQKELQFFRTAASEVEVHSQKVFDEVRRHLDKMRQDREKHQNMIAREMTELRKYVLRMTYEMVEHERDVIHQRLKETVGVKVADQAVERRKGTDISEQAVPATPISDDDRERDERELERKVDDGDQTLAEGILPADNEEASPVVNEHISVSSEMLVDDNIVQVQNGSLLHANEYSGQDMMLMSWEVLAMLVVMSLFGGCVGLRVRNINRRKKWYEERRNRRRRQARLARQRAMEKELVDEWENAGTESSVETVEFMRLSGSHNAFTNAVRQQSQEHPENQEKDHTADDVPEEIIQDESDEVVHRRERETRIDGSTTAIRSSPHELEPTAYRIATNERYSFVKNDTLPNFLRRSPRIHRRPQSRYS